jgi:chaperonin cofactor prefoldin
MAILTEVSWGELIDKYTILAIKAERIHDPAKLKNIHAELASLDEAHQQAHRLNVEVAVAEARLKAINEALWDIEDHIRDCERVKEFGPRFVELARGVYVTNDERSAVKREINTLLGSALVEEKSYQPY